MSARMNGVLEIKTPFLRNAAPLGSLLYWTRPLTDTETNI